MVLQLNCVLFIFLKICNQLATFIQNGFLVLLHTHLSHSLSHFPTKWWYVDSFENWSLWYFEWMSTLSTSFPDWSNSITTTASTAAHDRCCCRAEIGTAYVLTFCCDVLRADIFGEIRSTILHTHTHTHTETWWHRIFIQCLILSEHTNSWGHNFCNETLTPCSCSSCTSRLHI